MRPLYRELFFLIIISLFFVGVLADMLGTYDFTIDTSDLQPGQVVGYKTYSQDNSGNWNVSDIRTFVVLDSSTTSTTITTSTSTTTTSTTICGNLKVFKFHDYNNNGAWNFLESRLTGFLFHVEGPISFDLTTNFWGEAYQYCIPLGEYTITEEVSEGWEITTSNPVIVNIDSIILKEIRFGNKRESQPVFTTTTTTSTITFTIPTIFTSTTSTTVPVCQPQCILWFRTQCIKWTSCDSTTTTTYLPITSTTTTTSTTSTVICYPRCLRWFRAQCLQWTECETTTTLPSTSSTLVSTTTLSSTTTTLQECDRMCLWWFRNRCIRWEDRC
jgi:hypothetical protein